jgi:hypothetical protein
MPHGSCPQLFYTHNDTLLHTHSNMNIRRSILAIALAVTALPMAAQDTDPMKGKTMGVIGDSYVRNHKEPMENTWHYKLAQKHSMKYINYGRNGNCLTLDLKQWGTGVYHRYSQMSDSLDYIVVIGGHNDTARIDSIGVETFKERLGELCRGMIDKWPEARIFFFTPWCCEDFEGSSREKVVDAMLEVCSDYGIPVFDSARRSGIHAASLAFRRKFFQRSDGKDTAHLNSRGHDRFMPVAEAFIMQYVGN